MQWIFGGMIFKNDNAARRITQRNSPPQVALRMVALLRTYIFPCRNTNRCLCVQPISYNGANIVQQSINMNQPVIYVSFNYRCVSFLAQIPYITRY